MYDFSFLAPCPSSGIIIQGEADEVVTPLAVQKLVDKLRTQRHITIHHDTIPGANHFFANELDLLMKSVDDYLDMRLDPSEPISRLDRPDQDVGENHDGGGDHQQAALASLPHHAPARRRRGSASAITPAPARRRLPMLTPFYEALTPSGP